MNLICEFRNYYKVKACGAKPLANGQRKWIQAIATGLDIRQLWISLCKTETINMSIIVLFLSLCSGKIVCVGNKQVSSNFSHIGSLGMP